MWVLDVLFALLIASCVAWVIVGIYSNHKESVAEKALRDTIYLEDLIKKHEYQSESSDKKGEKIMTCREKLKLEHPEFVSNEYGGGCKSCPDTYGYIKGAIADGPKCLRSFTNNNRIGCYECWDRPVEGEELPEKTYVQKLFEESIKLMREYVDSKNEPPKPVDRKEKYKDAALEIKAMYDAFMAAGFDGNKAYGLVRTFISRSLGKEEE